MAKQHMNQYQNDIKIKFEIKFFKNFKNNLARFGNLAQFGIKFYK